MSDEIKHADHECICKSHGFKKFLTVALGSFVGVYCALCLFCAIHKPIPPIMPPNPYIMPIAGYTAHCDCPCHKKMMGKMMKYHYEQMLKENNDLKKEIDD